MWFAAANAGEAGVGMCKRFLARRGFGLTLRIGHPVLDAINDLFFAEAGVFEGGDGVHRHRRYALQAPVEEPLHSWIGETGDVKHDRIATDGIELIRLRNLE